MLLTLFLVSFLLTLNSCDPDGERLLKDLLGSYIKYSRPVVNHKDVLRVGFGLKLTQILDVDEINQVFTTKMWVKQTWFDHKLKWDPFEYGGIKEIQIPSKRLWLPDIVLYNNAAGDFFITHFTKTKVKYTGQVTWEPPAIYKSYCPINIEYFPYDMQKVELFHVDDIYYNKTSIDKPMDLSDYSQSVEWDLIEVLAQRNKELYPCCPGEYWVDITYQFTIRRKTLYYNVNLIFPCVIISLIAVFVFYLPSESQEKITLCISIQVTLTVFFSLLVDIIPPTSLVSPLISRYLLFTMILVTLSIVVTVIVLNVHYRTPATHILSPRTRRIFLKVLPKYLLMSRPKSQQRMSEELFTYTRSLMKTQYTQNEAPPRFPSMTGEEIIIGNKNRQNMSRKTLALELAKDGIFFISEHIRYEDRCHQIQEDWKFIALVLDRLFLWIFTGVGVLGTLTLIFNAPTLYDKRSPLK